MNALYDSNTLTADKLNATVHFNVPSVANGMVYVGTSAGTLLGYGLKSTYLASDSSFFSAPTAASAALVTATDARVSWTSNSSLATEFRIDRSPDGTSNWTTLAYVGNSWTTYDDTSVTPGTSYYYRVVAIAGNKLTAASNTALLAPPLVTGRYVFYNDSYWSGGSGHTHDTAIDPSKTALLPGQTATFANYTGSSLGINGVMIDISKLPSAAALTAADFAFATGNDSNPSGWTGSPAAPAITLRRGAGAGGSDRIELVWPDGAIQTTWLQVTVKADANTALAAPDVFYFGNAVGETGNSPTDTFVDGSDMIGIRDNVSPVFSTAAVDNVWDLNHDGVVDGTDMIIARDHVSDPFNPLRFIAPPATPAARAPAVAPSRSVKSTVETTPPLTGTVPATIQKHRRHWHHP